MDKREARKQYKLKKTPKGIFLVRCKPSGELWAGASTHLDSERNGLWFVLRLGSHKNHGLQAAWKTHGEEAFEFEVLETLDDDLLPMAVKDTLKEREKHWAAQRGALTI